MKNFKIGDRVRRININHYSMQIGDIGTIIWINDMGCTVRLKEYPHFHTRNNLTKVGSINCPKIVVREHHWNSV